jgi:hypothetical protein
VTATARNRATRRVQLRATTTTVAFWVLGSGVVALAQPGTDRRLAAIGTAGVAIGVILAVSLLTEDADRRYFRALVAGIIAVPVSSTWLLNHLMGSLGSFRIDGLETRIGLPLMVVLFAPLAILALPDDFRRPRVIWQSRSLLAHGARPMDWIVLAYAALAVPGLALGVAHHASKTYIAQDLGLVVFFVFMYAAGRIAAAEAARASAGELVGLLLLLAVATPLFLGGVTPPLYTFLGAACAAAIGFVVLRPRDAGLLPVGLAVVLLIGQAVAIRNGSGSTTAVELAGALGIVVYLAVRRWRLVPQWLVVAVAVVGVAGFVGFTSDGRTLQGRYQGPDPSNTGRTFEAHQVRAEVKNSKPALVLGRGFGATIDETGAPVVFQQSLLSGGRDVAHVQEVHLLAYEFLLKNGLLGFAWLGVFVLALGILAVGALETAAGERDPRLVVYAALPVLGLAVGLAAATHLQVNPLNALSIGVLATSLGPKRLPVLRPAFALPAVAVICAVAGAVFFTRPIAQPAVVATRSASVDDVRFDYPLSYHVRRFSTSNPAITGVHGIRVHGIVVASYRLKANPEVSGLNPTVGGSGASLRPDGVLFELYRAPRHQPGHKAETLTFPLSVPDFHRGLLFFKANGHDYWAIAWVGDNISEADRAAVVALMGSIQSG